MYCYISFIDHPAGVFLNSSKKWEVAWAMQHTTTEVTQYYKIVNLPFSSMHAAIC